MARDSTVSAEAAQRPDLKGYGTLTDLHVAMTLDPSLISVVDAALPSLNTLSLATCAMPCARSSTSGKSPCRCRGHAGTEATTQDFNSSAPPIAGATVYDFLIEKQIAGGRTCLRRGQPFSMRMETPSTGPRKAGAGEHAAAGQLEYADRGQSSISRTLYGSPIGLGLTVTERRYISAVSGALTASWNEINKLAVILASQGPLSSFFAACPMTPPATCSVPRRSTAGAVLEAIFHATPTNPADAESYSRNGPTSSA